MRACRASSASARSIPTSITGIDVDLSVLTLPEEQELMKALLDYPSLVAGAAEALEPHRVATYLHDTASKIHLWYHKAHVLNEPEPIMSARLVLARASQLVLRNGLALLGSPRRSACDDARPPPASRFPHMTVLVVGSVALDSVETPFGKADNVLGGSGTFFSASASHLAPVQLVGVIGSDYPLDKLQEAFKSRQVDLAGLERAEGTSFRWRGRYRHDLNAAETLETHLGVFSNFRPKIPEQFRSAPFVFLGNIDPRLQLDVLTQVAQARSSWRATR